MKTKLLYLGFLVIPFVSKAEKHRFIVFLADKDTASYHTHIDSAYHFLSSKAIERRKRWDIAITPEDFPVNSSYISSVSNTGVDVFHRSKWFNCISIEADSSQLPGISALPFVSSIEYVGWGSQQNANMVDKERLTNQTSLSNPNNLNSNRQLNLMAADHMHLDGYKGQGILIAVFDGGFLNVDKIAGFRHLFDNEQILATKNFVEYKEDIYSHQYHGTMVLSCLAAIGDDISGTAPMADYILLVTEEYQIGNETDTEYRVEEYNWLFAAEYADSIGVDLVNSSLGYGPGFSDPSMSYQPSDLDGKTTVISRAAQKLSDKGVLIVTSAGNEGNNVSWDGKITSPADVADVLAVGSINKDRYLNGFSSKGPTATGALKPDIVAMGGNTVVISETGEMGHRSGTSFAAPLAAGLIAGIWERASGLGPKELMDSLKHTSSRNDSADNKVGYGLPNYLSFFGEEVLAIEDNPVHSNIKLFPNPARDLITIIGVEGIDSKIMLFNITGNQITIKPIMRSHDKAEIDISGLDEGMFFIKIGSHTIKFYKI